jgi:hypothetical protein
MTATSQTTSTPEEACQAVIDVLLPLARLCLGKGITYAVVAESLKQAFVQEATALHPGAPAHGTVSRISTTTGLTRREVLRLSKSEAPLRSMKVPIGTAVFARWTTDPHYLDADGAPLVLKRQGPAPSFETLAQAMSRDVHPRSLLDELVRLGVVEHEESLDMVSLAKDAFVPLGDQNRMLDLLGDNVGDHLSAAVANVLHDGNRHLEQAVFADELSAESIRSLYPLITDHWKALRDAMVPRLTALIEADRVAGRPQDQRLRLGLYSYCDSMPGASPPVETPTPNRKNHTKESHR